VSYIRHILQDGEQVRHTAKMHWITYVPALLELFAGAVLAIGAQAWSAPVLFYFAVLMLVVAVIHFLALWIVRWTTEIAVTNRRVIYKTGLISRETNEMNMDKVESVKVDQSILGRLLDYGDVTVLGTGAGFEPLRKIAAPLSLRNHITGV
jgi:uncharacterized membrane protein YdbT with pleckstrin-like domain